MPSSKKQYKIVALLLLLLCFSKFAEAQFPPKIERKCYVHSYWDVSKNYISTPFKWKGKQWIMTGSCIAAGAGLYFADEWIYNNRPILSANGEKFLSYGIDYWGNGIYSMPLLAGMFLYGTIGKHSKPVEVSLKAVQSFVLSTIVTRALKYALNRARPYNDLGSQFWQPFQSPFNVSFPSGHATAAFAVATVLGISYKDSKLIPIVAYGLASAVAISRVWSGQHWASDVFAGTLIGVTMGATVAHYSCNAETTGWHIDGTSLRYIF